MAYRLPGGKDTSNDFSQALGAAVQTYTQGKKMEAAKAVLDNPDSTPIQKAVALAEMGHEKIGSDVYKGSLKEAEQAALNSAYEPGGAPSPQQNAPPPQEPQRDRSWRDQAMAGRTAPIRDAGPANTAQPGEEGTPSQRPFTVNGPQNAGRNETALNVPPVGGAPQGGQQNAPQVVPTQDPFAIAQEMRNRAGKMNIFRHGSGDALLKQADSIEKTARADKKAEQDNSIAQQKENRKEIAEAFKPYSDFGAIDKLEKDLVEAEDLILNKNVSFDTNKLGSIIAAIAEGKEASVADLFKTKDQQKLFSVLRSSLKPKTEGGSNPSTREVLLSMSAIPSYMKSQEANAYIVGNLLEDVRTNKVRAKIMNDLRKDPNITAPEFYERTHQAMQPYLEESRQRTKIRNGMLTATSEVADKVPSPGHLFMFDPSSGDVFEAPAEDRQLLESQNIIMLPSKRSR